MDEEIVAPTEPAETAIVELDYLLCIAQSRRDQAIAKQKMEAMEQKYKTDPEYLAAKTVFLSMAKMIELMSDAAKKKYQNEAKVDDKDNIINKKPVPGISLKKFDTTHLSDYDHVIALEYCKENFVPAVQPVQLNQKVFENAALTGVLPITLVKVIKGYEIRAQIDTNLDALIPADKKVQSSSEEE